MALPDGVTSAAEIRRLREQGEPERLLSGITVRMRTVTPDLLLKSGKMPDLLSPLVLKMMFQEVEGYELDDFLARREQEKDALEVIESINLVCEAALVYPRMVAHPTADDEICAEDLGLADRGWIFKLAFRPAEALRYFRSQQARNVEAVSDIEGDVQPAEPLDVRAGQANGVPV